MTVPPPLPSKVKIVEVGPRDGLQNEKQPIPAADKIAFIQALARSGLKQIEATSFVHPQAIPQLADAADVMTALRECHDDVTYSALVPNQKGLDRAAECGVKRIAVFTAASQTFARKNIRMTVEESLNVFKSVVASALERGMTVRGYVSTCFVCPYEGAIDKTRVLEVARALWEMGVDEVAVSDTLGAAAPTDVFETVGFLLDRLPRERLALHFHDTYGTALANVLAGLQLGISAFDASAGGLGGCPYAPGAAGNLATEDLVYLLDKMNVETGVDLTQVVHAARRVGALLQRPLPSRQLHRLRETD